MNKAMLLKQYLSYHKKSSARLPSAYQEVEYIESTGTQYIDSGYNINDNKVKIQIKFRINDWNESGFYFGCGYVGGSNAFTASTSYLAIGSNTISAFPNQDSMVGVINELEMEANESTKKYSFSIINGIRGTGSYSGTIKSNLSMPIFKGTLYSGCCDCRVYSFRLYANDVLQRDFIPCYRKSDNEIGLYDIVNNQFYTNQGTGSFLCGRPLVYDTIAGYEQIDYIESNGTQAITIDFVENPLIVPLYVEIDEAKTIFIGTEWELSDWIHGGSNYCPFKVGASKITIRYTSYVDTQVSTLSLNTRYVFNTYFSNGKQVVKKDGEEVVNLTQTGELSFKRLNIFAYNTSQSIGDFSTMKLYSFKLYKDDGYIFNLIPMRRKLDGELGLYDLVNNQFHTNSGSGSFIAGEILKA